MGAGFSILSLFALLPTFVGRYSCAVDVRRVDVTNVVDRMMVSHNISAQKLILVRPDARPFWLDDRKEKKSQHSGCFPGNQTMWYHTDPEILPETWSLIRYWEA